MTECFAVLPPLEELGKGLGSGNRDWGLGSCSERVNLVFSSNIGLPLRAM